jgi:hypothetical protein
VADTTAMAIATTQERLAQLRQSGTTAPMTVRRRSPERLGRERFIARDRHRVDRHHTIRRRRE